jgi:ATP-dependent helicase/nuclease subunit A
MKPVDIAERIRIVKDLGTTFLIEAGAGSGKTKSLVDRMIAYLRKGVCRIDTLAAVTFTRKAAAELRERFQTNLEKAYVEEKGKEVHQRLGESIQNLEQCFIGTIHSFCARMLRERPIEIALMPDFQELDDIDDVVFREKCWLDYLVEVRRESTPELAGLEEVGLEPEDLKDAFTTISMYPEVDLFGGKDKPLDFKAVKKKLEDFLAKMRKAVPHKTQEETRDDFQRRMVRLFVRQKNIGFDNPLVMMEAMEQLEKKFSITQKHWPDNDVAKAALADFENFRDRVVRKVLKEWREYRHSRAIAFLKPAVRFYYEQREKNSLVNFADLLMSVSKLLRDNPQVRAYFRKKFTHILVDEFQDTDPIQAEMLMYLTGEELEEKDWKKLSPKPGSLFLVGDPKQSIYRFRRADIDTYNVVRDQILGAGGAVLRLTSNFRSLGSLAEWNNPLFKQTFPEKLDRYQAPYAPINTVRKNEEEAWAGVYKITVEKKSRRKQKSIADEDAEKIAGWIKWACDGNVKLARIKEENVRGVGEEATPSDFLLLFRYKKLMNMYARKLEERGIPYEITGSDAFTDSGDINEIVNLARALRDPDNPVLTVSVLRAIFFGVSDNDLFNFRKNGGRFYFIRDWNLEGGQGTKYVAKCLGVMKKWWRWTKDMPASTAMEKIVEDSGIINYLASSEMGSSKAGNVLKLIEFLRNRERDGKTSFPDVVDYMEELVEVHEVEEMSLTPGRVNAVRLMNLHKAKGLEAPVVFLANPVGVRDHKPDKHVVRPEKGRPKGYFVFTKKEWFQSKILSQPEVWADRAEEENRYQAAEEERLMYVAATRAKNMMVLSTYEGNLPNQSWKLLDGNIGDVPELNIMKHMPEPDHIIGRGKVSISPKKYEDVRKSLRSNLEQWVEPSYLVESVTSLVKPEGARAGWIESGRGMSWGRVVHHVLNVVGSGDDVDLDLLARNALVAEDRDPGEKGLLLELVRAILESELWERVQKAEKKYFEIPFSLKSDTAELKRKKSSGGEGNGKPMPVIVSGVIDLVFREPDGWVIVDYKTDEVGANLQRYVDYYAPQVRLYREFWENITGELVKESALYFTSIKKYIGVAH